MEHSGYKSYDLLVNNIKGILIKLESANLDISEYHDKLNKIIKEVKNDKSLKNEMFTETMQLDYETFIYSKYITKLKELEGKLETEMQPFYELYLLTKTIRAQLKTITNQTLNSIIENTYKLINALNEVPTYNEKSKKVLIKAAYKTIYSVILHEEIFKRSDVLNYINALNIQTHIEYLGLLLKKDLSQISEMNLIEADLENLNTEGLGYDYLNETIIREISQKKLRKVETEYVTQKDEAIATLRAKVKKIKSRIEEAKLNFIINKKELQNLKIEKNKLIAKGLSLLFIPFITFGAGKTTGSMLSNRITEYRTITKTFDLDTMEMIGEPIETYEEKETTYVATILKYSPWQEKQSKSGYISNVTAYEYTTPSDKNYHFTLDDLNDCVEKYTFTESKETLEERDSTENITILLTETYQDKEHTQKSTKYILPFSLLGIGSGLIIDVILILFANFGPTETIACLETILEKIKKNKLDKETLENTLKSYQMETILLQEEYNNLVKDFGSINDLILPDISDICFIPETLKRTKKL